VIVCAWPDLNKTNNSLAELSILLLLTTDTSWNSTIFSFSEFSITPTADIKTKANKKDFENNSESIKKMLEDFDNRLSAIFTIKG
jgi:hypothetical protein